MFTWHRENMTFFKKRCAWYGEAPFINKKINKQIIERSRLKLSIRNIRKAYCKQRYLCYFHKASDERTFRWNKYQRCKTLQKKMWSLYLVIKSILVKKSKLIKKGSIRDTCDNWRSNIGWLWYLTPSIYSLLICSFYRTVPSAIWEIFSEFLIFCNLFHGATCDNYFIVKWLSK